MADVGRCVTVLRRARGWTQEQFAERLRVDARTLQRIEAGRHITFAMLVHLADALLVPIGELFGPPVERKPRRPGRPVLRHPEGVDQDTSRAMENAVQVIDGVKERPAKRSGPRRRQR